MNERLKKKKKTRRKKEKGLRESTTGSDRQRRNGETAWHVELAINRAMLAINATLIYHALTYDADGSRTSQDKTNRRNWRWQAVSCRSGAPLVFAARYFAPETNKTWLINKCVNIAASVNNLPRRTFARVRRHRDLVDPFSCISNERHRFRRNGFSLWRRRRKKRRKRKIDSWEK